MLKGKRKKLDKNKDGKLPNNEYTNFKVGTGKGDFLKMYQDPTSLGFKLFFINIADAKNDRTPQPISQLDTVTTINSTGLFGNEDNPNSALYYLKSIGDNARVEMLKDFKALLSQLNTLYPWYFQTIEGLSEAWSRDYTVAKFKKEITIQCLEAIDLRITALMDLYRKVAYDWKHRRAILPDNLRKFDLSIKVYDIRNFQRNPGKYLENNNTNENKRIENTEFLGNDFTDTTQVTFNLSQCEFMPDDSGAVFDGVSNATYDHATQVIKFSYENIEEDNIYRSLVALSGKSHYYVKDYLRKELQFLNSTGQNINSLGKEVMPNDLGQNNPNYNTLDTSSQTLEDQNISLNEKIGNVYGIDTSSQTLEDRRRFFVEQSNRAKQELGSLFDDLTQNVSAEAANLVRNRLTSLYLGNVYGFSASTVTGTARNSIVTAPGKGVRDIGNVFGGE